MEKQYSVLMSVYVKEKPEYFRAALDSMLRQTLPPTEVVLVCDGPLTEALDEVIAEYEGRFPEQFAPESDLLTPLFRVIRLPENGGLGRALAIGLRQCQCEWIARMDTDDIAPENRCELQMGYLDQHPEVDVLSGTLAEFQGDSVDVNEIQNRVVSLKPLPEDHEAIAAYLKSRNPVNHPCVMFRKAKAVEAGGYQPCLYFEDYDLWVRIFLQQGRFANLPEVIHYMRVNEMHRRRGGWGDVKAIVSFRTKMYREKVITLSEYLVTTTARIIVSLLPNRIRKLIYDKKLREKVS